MRDFTREAPITKVAGRTLTVQLLAWDQPHTVCDDGRHTYTERWARDSLIPQPRLHVKDRHGGELIGRMAPPTDGGEGPQAEITVADTAAGRDLLALVDADVIDSVSIEARADPAGEVWSSDHTEVTRTRAELAGVAFAFHPAHQAPILARTGDHMTMTDTPPAEPEPETPEPEPEQLTRSIDAVQAELVDQRRQVTELLRRTPGPAPRARFSTLGELMRAAVADHARELPRDPMGGGVVIERALLDVTSADVPGLMLPQQIREIYAVIEATQPLAEAAGSAPAPTSLTYTFPKVDVRPLVGTQAGEKTEIVSRETKVSSATVQVLTLAGGEDTSIQVIQLADPSYAQISGMLYAEEMARATDVAAYTAYDAAAVHNASIGTAASGWVPALFDLAGDILSASRRFPDRLVLSTDLWVKIGGAVDGDGRPIFTNTSPANPAGSASLTSPDGDVRGLSFTVDPHLPADRGLMFASSAFRAGLGPVQTMTADVPAKLGRDFAMFRFGAFLAVDPQGMGLFASGTAPTTASSGRGSKKA